jgi:hypothetical protein
MVVLPFQMGSGIGVVENTIRTTGWVELGGNVESQTLD